MKYDRAVKDYLLSYVDITDLIAHKVDLKRVGNSMRGLCPFHTEKTPSFYVSNTRNSYYCFGCKEHGNAIDFVMQTENLEFLEALESLADRYSIDLSSYLIQGETKQDFSLLDKIYAMNREAGKFYHNQLINNKIALEYFEDRKLTLATIKSFGLGYAPDSWDALLKHLKKFNYTEQDALQAGLASKSDKGKIFDRFRNRVIYPIFDYRSRILGFGARTLGDDMPKYLNSPESLVFQKSKILYGDRMARKAGRSDSVILVEGYMDLLQVYQAGFKHVLASMGTALTAEQVHHISKRYKFVFFAYDMDEAGRNAISRTIPLLENYAVNVKVLDISPAKDPDEFIKKFGKLAFKEKLDSADNRIKFSLLNIKGKYDLSDAKERFDYIMESIALIAKLCSSVEAELYLQELADISMVPYDKILSEFNVFDGKKQTVVDNSDEDTAYDTWDEHGNVAEKKVLDINLYEKRLVAFAINSKEYALKILENTDGDFYTEEFLTVFSVLMMYYSTNDQFDPISISEDLDLDSAISLQNILDSSEAEFKDEELSFLLARWQAEKLKIHIDEIDLEIKKLSFLDDEESKIKLRALRKKRSTLLKNAYKNEK